MNSSQRTDTHTHARSHDNTVPYASTRFDALAYGIAICPPHTLWQLFAAFYSLNTRILPYM